MTEDKKGEQVWRANLLVVARLAISPLVYAIVMLFCAAMMAFYALAVWPLTGKTVIRLGWEGDDGEERSTTFFTPPVESRP